MDHQHARPEGARPKPAAPPRQKASEPPEAGGLGDLMQLQRTAGNRAVADKLTNVQRHRLDPENMG